MNEEDIKNCHDALMRAIEEENKKMDRRNRWCKRLKVLMILGFLMAFSGVTILAFAKSLSAGFIVLGISFIFPYGLYEFYNEC